LVRRECSNATALSDRRWVALGIHGATGASCLPSRFITCTRPIAMVEVAQSITMGKPIAPAWGTPTNAVRAHRRVFAAERHNSDVAEVQFV